MKIKIFKIKEIIPDGFEIYLAMKTPEKYYINDYSQNTEVIKKYDRFVEYKRIGYNITDILNSLDDFLDEINAKADFAYYSAHNKIKIIVYYKDTVIACGIYNCPDYLDKKILNKKYKNYNIIIN